MWYFLIKQDELRNGQYQALQQKAALTEIELFNEPYYNWYVFNVKREQYKSFMEYLDLAGIRYDAFVNKPMREELLASMR